MVYQTGPSIFTKRTLLKQIVGMGQHVLYHILVVDDPFTTYFSVKTKKIHDSMSKNWPLKSAFAGKAPLFRPTQIVHYIFIIYTHIICIYI